MTLSDREKRLLEEMEAALLTEDPRLVSALSSIPSSPSRNRILVGAGVLVLGLVVVFTGLILKVTPVGVLGFLIALGGLISAISGFSPQSGGFKKPKAKRSTLGSRMEKRWDERKDQ